MKIKTTPLASEIAEEIGNGRMPFAHFMERALYDTDRGYYMKPLPIELQERDYFTSADVSEVFGQCLARQFAEIWKILGKPENFHIIELGAGRGLLCQDVYNSLKSESPDCISQTNYIVVEKSAGRWNNQQQGSEPNNAINQNCITKLDDIANLPSGITGVVYSNEFFDALPIHRVCPFGDNFLEVYVRVRNGEFYEELGEPSTQELQAYFDRLEITFAEGKKDGRTEVNLQAVETMKIIGRKLNCGLVLTFDYGYPADELFTPKRIAGGGTLMCYNRHKAHANPYIHVGEQDITTHVDFSSLALAGMEVNMNTVGFTDQHHALVGLGIANELVPLMNTKETNSPGGIRRNLAIKTLLLPGGLGGTLKVLVQEKGIGVSVAEKLSALRSSLYNTKDLLQGK